MSKRKFITLALAGSLGLTSLFTPMMSTEAASTVSEYDTLISELVSEENNIVEKLNTLKEEIKVNEAEAIKLAGQMAETKIELEKLKAEIEALKAIIEQRTAQLETQARGVQVMGSSSNVISFLLNAESMDDIVGRINVVSTLIDSNRQGLQQQQDDKDLVEAKEAEVAHKQEEQKTLAQKLETQKVTLKSQKLEEEKVLAKISSDKAIAQKERNILAERARAEAEAKAAAAAAAVKAKQVQVASSKVSANTASVSTSSSAVSTPVIASSGGWTRPATGGYVSSRYGYRWGSLHAGIDIADRSNGGNGPIAIIAAKAGTVTTAGFHYSYGNYVVINHGNGLSTLYAHMLGNLNVSSGQAVSAGQRLGTMGSTGDSTGYHLHFEIHQNGSRVNPENYMSF